MSSGAEIGGKAVEPAGSAEASSFGRAAAGASQPEITGVYVRPVAESVQEIQGIALTRRRKRNPLHAIPSPRTQPSIENIPQEQPQQPEASEVTNPQDTPLEAGSKGEPHKKFVLFAGPHGEDDKKLLKPVGRTIKKMARKAPPETKVVLWMEVTDFSVKESVAVTKAVARNVPPSLALTDEIVKTREQTLEAIRAHLTEAEVKAEQDRIEQYRQQAPAAVLDGFWGKLVRKLDSFVHDQPGRLVLLTEWESAQTRDLAQTRSDVLHAYEQRFGERDVTEEELVEFLHHKLILDADYHRSREVSGPAYIARHMHRDDIAAGAAVIGYSHALGFAEQLGKNGVPNEIVYLGNKGKPYILGPVYSLMREKIHNPDALIIPADVADAYNEEALVKERILPAQRASQRLARVHKLAYESWMQKRQGNV